jgi:succinate dehydrogenase / fumarate reductase membrane anchor subunit
MTTSPPFFQPPLAKAKGLGSAHQGSHHWILQRATALFLIPLSLWFMIDLIRHINSDYGAVVSWISQPWIGALLLGFVIAMSCHMFLGIQVIAEDYAPSKAWKYWIILKTKAYAWSIILLSFFFILKITILGLK